MISGCRNSTVAVKKASPLELRAVSTESCTTLMMKPTPTACIAIPFPMPRKEQAIGMRSSEPPAAPFMLMVAPSGMLTE